MAGGSVASSVLRELLDPRSELSSSESDAWNDALDPAVGSDSRSFSPSRRISRLAAPRLQAYAYLCHILPSMVFSKAALATGNCFFQGCFFGLHVSLTVEESITKAGHFPSTFFKA